jgi:hypothetical protein
MSFMFHNWENAYKFQKNKCPEELQVGEDLTYHEYLVRILDTLEKLTRNNWYRMCKVQWSNHTKEATWEKED